MWCRLLRGGMRIWAPRAVFVLVLSVIVGATLASGAPVERTAGPAAIGPNANASAVEQPTLAEHEFGFVNESYRAEPPETAEIGLTVPAGGVFSVLIEAPGEHFTVEVTAGVTGNDSENGTPTVQLDTGNVSADDPGEYLSVTNATLHRITVHQHAIEGALPGGEYDVRAVRGDERAAATLRVAPSVTLSFESQLNRSDLEREPVRTITGQTDIDPGESIEIRVTSTDQFRITSEAVVAADGSFETTVDLGPVPAGASLEVTAHYDGLPRARHAVDLLGDLPEPVDGRQASDGITFAYEGDALTLEAGANQSITGETTLAEGTIVTFVLRSPHSHLYVASTTVDSHGSFTVTADLDGLQPRTDVIISAVADGDASGAAPVTLVAPERTDDAGVAPDAMTGEILLADASEADANSDGGPFLVGGLLALGLGVVLSLLASGLLLGLDRSVLSPQGE